MNEEYSKLQEKYSLPLFEELDNNYEIRDIDKEEDIIRELLRKIYEKADFYTKLLEDLIQPDSRLSTMIESSKFNSVEMQLVNEVHMKGMLITRELIEANLDYSEENAAKVIIKTHKEWLNLKKDLIKIVGKLKEAWRENIKTNVDRGYFG